MPDSRKEAERDLATLKNRDQIVRRAHQLGIEKKRIHQLSGIARSTIDRILKEQ